MHKSGLMELEAVVAIARLGSFRAAALELEMSPTAIGNAVAGLENRLGVRLFNRTTRNVALTSAGREYVEAIAPALSDIRNAARALADHSRKPTGTLRFSCSLGGGRRLLMPFVFEYLRRYSEMKVEIVTEGRLIDIITDGFDAGVRLAETVPQDMIAVPLGPNARHVVVGAPSYFAKRSRPTTPADLMDHECIRARHSSGALYRCLHSNAHGDRANLFFLGQPPALIGQDRPLAKQLLKVHETVGLFLLGLIALHASAALYHHFWRRDDTLKAMLPQGMRRRVARRSSTGISSRARPKLPPAPGNAG
jgi:DNA-binding transcriptional LysR family regulator